MSYELRVSALKNEKSLLSWKYILNFLLEQNFVLYVCFNSKLEAFCKYLNSYDFFTF